MDPALQTDLRAPAFPALHRAPGDLVDVEEVGGAAKVLRQASLREGAEATAEVADVRVVDVPADDVRDLVAVAFTPPGVGGLDEPGEFRSAGR